MQSRNAPCTSLNGTSPFHPGGVRVKVSHGWITLTGQVEWRFQRFAAEQSVRKLSGVVGVSNDIELALFVDPPVTFGTASSKR